MALEGVTLSASQLEAAQGEGKAGWGLRVKAGVHDLHVTDGLFVTEARRGGGGGWGGERGAEGGGGGGSHGPCDADTGQESEFARALHVIRPPRQGAGGAGAWRVGREEHAIRIAARIGSVAGGAVAADGLGRAGVGDTRVGEGVGLALEPLQARPHDVTRMHARTHVCVCVCVCVYV